MSSKKPTPTPANNSFGVEPVKLALFEGWGKVFDLIPPIRSEKDKQHRDAYNKGYQDGKNAAFLYLKDVRCIRWIHTYTSQYEADPVGYMQGFKAGFRVRFFEMAIPRYNFGYAAGRNGANPITTNSNLDYYSVFENEGIRNGKKDRARKPSAKSG
jgi:hypothetical protein